MQSRVTAGAQPVSALAAATPTVPSVEADENPLLPRFASGSTAGLLRQAVATFATTGGVDFRSISRATRDVNLAFLDADGRSGDFSPSIAGTAAQAYLTALRSGTGTGASDLSAAYLRFLAADGLGGLTKAQRSIVGVYQNVTATGGTFSDVAVGTAYSDYLRALAAGQATSLAPPAVAAYDAYARQLSFGATLDAARRA